MERQASFLETNTFILSTETATSILEQLQGILRQQRMLEDIPERERPPTMSGGTEEQRLLSWLRSSRPYLGRDTSLPSPSSSTTMTIVTKLTTLPLPPGQTRLHAIPLWREQEGGPSREQLEHTRTMLVKEIDWLTHHLEGVRIIMQSEPWGYDLLVSLNNCQGRLAQISVQLPPSYPSERLYIRSIRGADSIVHDINQGYLRIFSPISLTAVVRIFKYALGDGGDDNVDT